MPFYEYKCKECGTVMKDLVKMDDRYLPEKNVSCEKCGKKELKLVIATPHIRTDSMRL